MRHVQLLVIVFVLCHNGVAGELPDRAILKVDLQQYTRSAFGVEFSEDSRSLCVYWLPDPPTGDYTKMRWEFVVFDLVGRALDISHTSTNRLKTLHDFPSLAWREDQQEFIKDSVAWAFARDFSQGLRVKRIKDFEHTAELWALPAQGKPLWAAKLPECTQPKPAKLLLDSNDKTIVLRTLGQEVVVLNRETGRRVSTFSLGPIESDADLAKRKRKFGLLFAEDQNFAFSTFALSQDTSRGWLAGGAFHDKRVRVVDMTSAGKIVFEANTDVNPTWPLGGRWSVRRVEFFADARYLLADYHFGGRGAAAKEPSEIFDTATWKSVWQKDDLEIRSVTLSPDGKKLAFIHDHVLEVHPFASGSHPASQK